MSIDHRSSSIEHRPPGPRHRTGVLGALVLALLVGCSEEPERVEDPVVVSVTSPFRYPVELWDADVEGEAVVMVRVSEGGAVDSVYVLEPSGEPAFDSAAVAGAYELEFAPGRRGDRSVAMWARLPVRFNRPEGDGGPNER